MKDGFDNEDEKELKESEASDEILAEIEPDTEEDAQVESEAYYEEEEQAESEAYYEEDEQAESDETSLEEKDYFFQYLLIAATAILLIAVGFVVGRFILPISEDMIENKKNEMLKTNISYQSAKSENELLTKEINKLTDDNHRIEETFNDVIEYQKRYDELKKEYDKLSSDLSDANTARNNAQNAYNGAVNALKQLHSSTVTLSPGTYTVGTHIPDGTYLVTGSGSLLTAGADRTLKVNIILDKTTPYKCELLVNDTIKLSTEAEFIPEVDEHE